MIFIPYAQYIPPLVYEVLPLICVNKFVYSVSQKQKVKKWPCFNKTTLYLECISILCLTTIGILMMKIRLSLAHLIFIARNQYLQRYWLYWYESLVLTVQLCCNWYFMHYRPITWAPGISIHWQLDSLSKKFVQVNIKETSNLCISCPLWRKSTGDCWIPWQSTCNAESI